MSQKDKVQKGRRMQNIPWMAWRDWIFRTVHSVLKLKCEIVNVMYYLTVLSNFPLTHKLTKVEFVDSELLDFLFICLFCSDGSRSSRLTCNLASICVEGIVLGFTVYC